MKLMKYEKSSDVIWMSSLTRCDPAELLLLIIFLLLLLFLLSLCLCITINVTLSYNRSCQDSYRERVRKCSCCWQNRLCSLKEKSLLESQASCVKQNKVSPVWTQREETQRRAFSFLKCFSFQAKTEQQRAVYHPDPASHSYIFMEFASPELSRH